MDNLLALERLNLLIREEDVWISSMDLAEISCKIHKNVMRDIKEDIVDGINAILRNLRTLLKFEPGSQETLMEYLNRVQEYVKGMNIDNIHTQSILSIKVKEIDRLTEGGRFTHYLLNREASLMVLSRYSPSVRIEVGHLFFKSVDLLKNRGYNLDNTDDMNAGLEDMLKSAVDLYLYDLEEDGVLSEFNAFYLMHTLLSKIPEKLNKYFTDNFPLYKRIRNQVHNKGNMNYVIEKEVKDKLGKNIKNNNKGDKKND